MKRFRELYNIPGRFSPGLKNMITDVPGVKVGHFSIHSDGNEKRIHTGITVIQPNDKDPYQFKLPAAIHSGNGFGKMTGFMQVEELGEIESFIGLTNTFSVCQVAQGLLDYHVPNIPGAMPSINVVVGETNDSYLSDMRGFHIKPDHVKTAIRNLTDHVEEGSVGAGSGTVCFGYKGGIGTASRNIPITASGFGMDYTVGVLLQTNFGGNLRIYGRQLPYKQLALPVQEQKGSCMIVVATNAPLSDRQLKRLAKRAVIGITDTGSFLSHGSGDFVIAFSNHESCLREVGKKSFETIFINDDKLNLFFEATVEAVTEAVYNSLIMNDKSYVSCNGKLVESFKLL